MHKLTYGSVTVLIDEGKRPLDVENRQNGSSFESKVFGWTYINQFSNLDGNYIKITRLGENRFEITRDKFGSIPIYYTNDLKIFNTNKKQMIDMHGKKLSKEGLSEYISCGLTSFRNTIYENINVLCPFEKILIDNDHATVINRENYFPKISDTYSPTEAINNCLLGAMKSISQLFPKIALNFSGGNDSTLLLFILRKLSSDLQIDTNTYFHTDWREDLNDWQYAEHLSKIFGTRHELCEINEGIFARSSSKLAALTKDAMHTYATAFFHQNSSICEDIPIINGTGPDECIVGTEKLAVDEMIKLDSTLYENWLPEVLHARDYVKMEDTELTFLIGKNFDPYLKKRNRLALSIVKDRSYLSFQRKFHSLVILQDHIKELTQVATVLNKQIIFPFLTDEFFEIVFATNFQELNSHGVYKHVIKEQLRGVVDDRIIDRPKVGFQSPSRAYFEENRTMRRELEKLLKGNSRVFELEKLRRSIEERLMKPTNLRQRYDFLEWTSLNILRLEKLNGYS